MSELAGFEPFRGEQAFRRLDLRVASGGRSRAIPRRFGAVVLAAVVAGCGGHHAESGYVTTLTAADREVADAYVHAVGTSQHCDAGDTYVVAEQRRRFCFYVDNPPTNPRFEPPQLRPRGTPNRGRDQRPCRYQRRELNDIGLGAVDAPPADAACRYYRLSNGPYGVWADVWVYVCRDDGASKVCYVDWTGRSDDRNADVRSGNRS